VDQWLYSRLSLTIETVNEALKNYRFHEAAQNVYQFFWGDFCDWYIEWVKPELQNANRERAVVAWKNLFAAFNDALRLLHPFMPFLTEELWHQLPQAAGAMSIALDSFPVPKASWANDQTARNMHVLQEIITFARDMRAELKKSPKQKVDLLFYTAANPIRDLVTDNAEVIQRLTWTELRISTTQFSYSDGAVRITNTYSMCMPHSEPTVTANDIARLKKDIEGLQKAVASKEKQLGDETFRSRAPEKIIRGLEATLADQRGELQKLRERMVELEKNK
jgi:valyl-tRNA synthetase